jgi:NAD(P)-dependent dehydrogenase (short-subunit alcohol dehydrogenase family)
MMEVNLRGTFLCCKYAAPAIVKAGSEAIINLAAMSAFRGPTPSIPYEVAKAGVIHLTKASAYQYTPLGIRINCVAPGNVETPMLKQGTGDAESWARRQEAQPLKRFGTPEEFANAILLVASDEASWISGVTIIVDGGKWAALQ